MESNVFAFPNGSTLARRNTIGVGRPSFNYRRPRMLQSTLLKNRNPNDNSTNSIGVGSSNYNKNPSTNEMTVDKVSNDEYQRPSIFCRENSENLSEQKDLSLFRQSSRYDNLQKLNGFKRQSPPTKEFLETKTDEIEEVQPALLFTKSQKKTSTPIVEKGETKTKLGSRKGPPLNSIRDYEPAIKRAKTITNADLPQRKESEIPEDDYWVTVFGFERDQLEKILELFNRHGNIIKHEQPEEGNWVKIRYASVTHAQQALARHGQLLDKTMIGVIPKTKPNGTDNLGIPIKIPGHNEKIADKLGLETSNSLSNSIRIEKCPYPGMRSCIVPGFKFDPPKSDESIMSKIFKVFK